MKREIVITKDGSPSVYVEELRESFHSLNGSLQESEHTFMKEGLQYLLNEFAPKSVNLFEMGFGTGLNALLAYAWANKNHQHLRYSGLEAFPLEDSIYKELKFDLGDQLDHSKALSSLHQVEWESWHQISDHFSFRKVNQTLTDYSFDVEHNLVFFDAFAPSVQPKLWSSEVFQNIYDAMETPGVLVTYSAAGAPRRAMTKAGFWINEIRGAAGKREMTRAVKW